MRKIFNHMLFFVLTGGGGQILLGADEPAAFTLSKITATATAAGYENVDATTIGVRQASLLRDILRDMPGVFVGGTNGLNQRAYIRGMNQSALNVQIDGARQSGIAYHHTQSFLVDPDILKAVDVSVGTSSIVGTSGGLGGSILFKTISAEDMLEPDKNFGFKLKSGYYTNDNQFQESAMVYGRTGGFDILGYVNWRHHDFGFTGSQFSLGKQYYYYEKEDTKKKTITPTQDTRRHTGGKGYEINTLLKAGYRFDEAQRLEASAEYIRYDGLYPVRAEFGSSPDDYKTNKDVDYGPQVFDRQTYTLHYDYAPSDNLKIKANTYYSNVSLDKSKYNLEYYNSSKVELFQAIAQNFGAKAEAFQKFDFNPTLAMDLIYGLEYYGVVQITKNNKKVEFKDKKVDKETAIPNRPSESSHDVNLYIQPTLAIKTGDVGVLRVIPGFRVEYYRLNQLRKPDKTKEEYSIYGENYFKPLGAFGLDYKTDVGVGVFANWTQVFKGPQVVEAKRLAEAEIIFADVEKLKAETGNNFEGGLTYKGRFGNYGLDVIAKGFYTKYDNLILEKRDRTSKAYTRTNSGEADVYGSEVGIKGKIYDFTATFGYTLTKIDYKYPQGNSDKGTNIAPETGDKYTLNLQYFITPIDVLVGWNTLLYTNYNKKEHGVFEHKPGYSVSDIYISYMPSQKSLQGLEIDFGVYNLFDEAYIAQTAKFTYVDSSADYEPGRNFRVSVSYQF
ncbi:TonB-dependent receptor [Helicobacter sp. 11S02596-1]|uniref:TonB-dependent receptor domain-containing protein n=1 Tax=Helicobacter sp. 11S02596-1 TaxID=1476194 RepID=UPI000BA78B0B|nr:TonB-dependent receptor [Helicobacter sp. 11S02596-1]PAF45095.1 hypothetical protein BJI48_00560 [Helicobacter sp. 11S02596-1]